MVDVLRVTRLGDSLSIALSDGKTSIAVPTSNSEFWQGTKSEGGGSNPDPEPGAGGWVWPFPQRDITCNYTCYPNHHGCDFAKPMGTPIRCAGDGVVHSVGDFGNAGAGRHIWVEHGVVGARGLIRSGYYHMRDNATLKPGARVKGGDILGYVGSTGNSTGPHLHLQFAQQGTIWEQNTVNPEVFLVEVGASGR